MRPQIADDDVAQHLSLNERLRRLEQQAAAYADSGWSDLQLVTPWVQYDATNFRPQYRRVGGVVHIRGLVMNTSAFAYGGSPANLQIATMPTDFRPSMSMMGEGYMLSTAGIRLILRLDLATSGAISISNGGDWTSGVPTTGNNGLASWLKLSFLPYPAD